MVFVWKPNLIAKYFMAAMTREEEMCNCEITENNFTEVLGNCIPNIL